MSGFQKLKIILSCAIIVLLGILMCFVRVSYQMTEFVSVPAEKVEEALAQCEQFMAANGFVLVETFPDELEVINVLKQSKRAARYYYNAKRRALLELRMGDDSSERPTVDESQKLTGDIFKYQVEKKALGMSGVYYWQAKGTPLRMHSRIEAEKEFFQQFVQSVPDMKHFVQPNPAKEMFKQDHLQKKPARPKG